MPRRGPRAKALRVALLAPLLTAATADAIVTSDVNNIQLTGTYSYLTLTSYSVSFDNDGGEWRWVSPAPGKDTTIAGFRCSDLSLLGDANFPAGNISFKTMFTAGGGTCFYLKGKTQSGQGNMTDPHDGKVRR